MNRVSPALLIASLFIVISGEAVAQDTTARISLTMRAARTPVVLAELGRLSNLKFETTAPTQNDVLAISANGVTIGDLMKRIATVTASEWRPIEGGFRLVPDSTERARQARVEQATRLAKFNETLKKKYDAMVENEKRITSNLKKGGSATPDAATAMVMAGLTSPADNTILRLAINVDRNVLANMQKGDRVVFSTNPTAMQRQLPGNAAALINAFVVEHNKNVQGGASAPDPELEKLPAFIRNMAERQTKRIDNPSKALLIFTKASLFDMLNCELRLYDAQGKVLASETSVLDQGSMADVMEMAADMAKPDKTKPAPGGDPTPVQYSDDAMIFASLAKGVSTASIKVSPAGLEKIYNPTKYDPLSFAPTDELFSLSKSLKLPLVANLTDNQVSLTESFTTQAKKTIGQVQNDLDSKKEIQRIADPGWLTVMPSKPEFSRNHRLDRFALESLLQAAKKNGVASLDDIAAYSLKADNPMEGGIGQIYVMEFVPGALSQGIQGVTNWDMLQFYALLPQELRVRLSNGARIPLTGLTSAQTAILNRMVYGASGHLEVARSGQQSDPADFMMKMMAQMGQGVGGTDYLDEPTESLASGIPGGTTITLKSSVDPTVNPIPAEGTVMMASASVMGPDELAILKMIKEEKSMAAAAGMMPSFDKVRIGQRVNWDFRFQFAPNLSINESLADNRLAADSAIVSFNALPANVNKSIDDRLAIIKKSPFGAMIGAMGSFGAGAGTIKP